MTKGQTQGTRKQIALSRALLYGSTTDQPKLLAEIGSSMGLEGKLLRKFVLRAPSITARCRAKIAAEAKSSR